MTSRASVLDGYRVLDLSIAMAGPLAAMRLGDLGADVLKIEPLTGEWQRHKPGGGAVGEEVNASFLALNRNKRSIAVNLKTERGRQVVLDLARDSDVFLQNLRPGVADRLGVGYEAIRAVRPDVVYVSISGYGESGPYVSRPGQDLLVQALGGALFSGGTHGEAPQPAPYFIADGISAYSAFEGVLAALLHRERTGEGQLVEVNMLDCLIALQMQELTIRIVGGVQQERGHQVHGHSYIRAPYGIFRTTDGFVALAFAELDVLAEVFEDAALGECDANDNSLAAREEISRRVGTHLASKTTSHWVDILGAKGVWVGPVNSYEELLGDPQVKHNRSFVTYEHPTEGKVTTPGFAFSMSKTPPAVRRPAPILGQHTNEVLAALGLSSVQIDSLIADGVVGQR